MIIQFTGLTSIFNVAILLWLLKGNGMLVTTCAMQKWATVHYIPE